jgi:hypothetical protein
MEFAQAHITFFDVHIYDIYFYFLENYLTCLHFHMLF